MDTEGQTIIKENDHVVLKKEKSMRVFKVKRKR